MVPFLVLAGGALIWLVLRAGGSADRPPPAEGPQHQPVHGARIPTGPSAPVPPVPARGRRGAAPPRPPSRSAAPAAPRAAPPAPGRAPRRAAPAPLRASAPPPRRRLGQRVPARAPPARAPRAARPPARRRRRSRAPPARPRPARPSASAASHIRFARGRVEIGRRAPRSVERLAVDVPAPRRDQRVEQRGRQPAAARIASASGATTSCAARRLAGGDLLERVAPPLQPHLGDHRLPRHPGRARDLEVEARRAARAAPAPRGSAARPSTAKRSGSPRSTSAAQASTLTPAAPRRGSASR